MQLGYVGHLLLFGLADGIGIVLNLLAYLCQLLLQLLADGIGLMDGLIQQDDTVLAGFGLMFLFPVCRSLLASFHLLLQHPDLLVQRCGIGRQPLMSLWPINHLFLWVLRCGGRCGRQQEAQEKQAEGNGNIKEFHE